MGPVRCSKFKTLQSRAHAANNGAPISKSEALSRPLAAMGRSLALASSESRWLSAYAVCQLSLFRRDREDHTLLVLTVAFRRPRVQRRAVASILCGATAELKTPCDACSTVLFSSVFAPFHDLSVGSVYGEVDRWACSFGPNPLTPMRHRVPH